MTQASLPPTEMATAFRCLAPLGNSGQRNRGATMAIWLLAQACGGVAPQFWAAKAGSRGSWTHERIRSRSLACVGDPAHRDRRRAIFCGPIPKLTSPVRAPVVDAAADKERTRVPATGGDSGRLNSTAHCNRRKAVCSGPTFTIAKLTFVIPAPTDASADKQRTRVFFAGGDSDGVSDTANHYRRSVIFSGPIPKLTVGVRAPAGDASADKQRTRVSFASRDGDGVSDTAHRDRRQAIFCGPIPKLTSRVRAPAVDAAADKQRTSVSAAASGRGVVGDRAAGGDRGGVRDAAHRDRRKAVMCGPVP